MSAFPIADRWFDRTAIDDSITLLWEPYVIPLMRCNIWHVRGRDRDLVVDTGMGLMSLSDELSDLVDKDVTAVATHGHDDHIGGHHEFDTVLVHPMEAPLLLAPPIASLVPREAWGDDVVDSLEAAGYPMPDAILRDRAYQSAWRSTRSIRSRWHACGTSKRATRSTSATAAARCCTCPVILPGRSGCGRNGPATLFSGDAIYDGPLLDELPESSIDDYCTTMDRLMSLPVTVVHAGHDPSFGRDRLRELATAYLRRRRQ